MLPLARLADDSAIGTQFGVKKVMHHSGVIGNWLLLGICFLAIVSYGCSHVKPYYLDPDDQTPIQINPDDVRQRLLLIGDAGKADPDGEVTLSKLSAWAQQVPDKSLVIFLGDNIYDYGLPPEGNIDRPEAERRLNAQINAVLRGKSKGLFVPGNHDWNSGDFGGLTRVKRQAAYVTRRLGPGSFLPTEGCAGPTKVDLQGIDLIVLDTEWWLHRYARGTKQCPAPNEEAIIDSLENLLANTGDDIAVIVAHHPLKTYGEHGGFAGWKDHIFPLTHIAPWLWVPLPLLGSAYPLSRRYILRRDQDVFGKRNKHMRKKLSEAMATNPPLIYANGHEHNLEVLDGQDVAGYLLISGNGSRLKTTPVGSGEQTIFAHEHPGFMVVDLLNDGRVLLRVIENRSPDMVFSRWIR